MKRLLLIFALALIVCAASATNLNFQNPTDYTQLVFESTSSASTAHYWAESSSGGNNYVVTMEYGDADNKNLWFHLASPYTSTYAAATASSNSAGGVFPYIVLQNAAGTVIYSYQTSAPVTNVQYRYEVKMVGGQAKIYRDGTLLVTSGAIATPSFIGFGMKKDTAYVPGGGWNPTITWDDYVYGQTENLVTLGLPESDNQTFIILEDILNNANNGITFGENGTQVSSTYMYGQWSRGNLSTTPEALENQTIQLINYFTNTVYATNYTGSAYSGTVQIDIKTLLIGANTPDGVYALYIPGSGHYSNQIWKKSNGASVTWSSKTYSTGDTGSVITVIANGGYWDPGAYEYTLVVQDVYGVAHGANTTITMQTETVTHTWADTDDQGVYYAVLYATSRSTGKQYIFGFDYTTLTANYRIEGYVNSDQTAQPIPTALLNWTQDSVRSNVTSNATGYYVTDSIFITGSTIGGNISATGHTTYWWNGTIAKSGSKFINITLAKNPHDYTGVALGGTDRESLYHRPLSAVYIRVYNTTYSEEWTMQTNSAGFYWIDEAATPTGYNYLGIGGGGGAGRDIDGAAATINPHMQGILTSGRLYCVEAYKIGYANTTECITVVGA